MELARLAQRGVAAVAGAAAPWLMLVLRVSLAQAFLVVQVTGLTLGNQLGAPLTNAWWVDAFHQLASSGVGTVVQAACPLLLMAGLLLRPAALAMVMQVLLMPPPDMTPGRFTLWLILLGWLVVAGPGPLSLDALFGRGAGSSALPGARALAGAVRWARRWLVPAYLTAMRLALAGALLRLVPGALGASGMAASLPRGGAEVAAALLAIGLGVRPVALLLALAAPFAIGAADEPLFFLLLLALLVVCGAGAPSVDAWLRRLLLRMPGGEGGKLPHVVVVGGGFGGVAAARALAYAPCRVTLVDRCNHQVFQPLLYQVATASLSPAEIASPIRSLFRQSANVRVLLAEVVGIDPRARTVQFDHGTLGYDHLVLATGARHAYLGHEEWAAHAPGLKSIEDATEIRGRLLLAFERAESTDDPAERAAWLTFIVVGGGPTGVKLAGAIRELARTGMQGEFRAIEPASARVLLVQSAKRLLPSFAESLSEAAADSLRKLGVEIRLGAKVETVRAGGVVIGGEEVPARTILWAAGVMASPAAAWLGVEADKAGRVPVGPDLSVPGHKDVFAVGDTAASMAWNGEAVPGLAPAAKQGGAYVGQVIRTRLAGRSAPPPFRYRHFGSLATIGRDAAVAEFGRVRLKGALAWWIWGAAHIAFLAGGRSQAAVVLDWLWAYLTFKRSTRLITGSPGASSH